MPFGCILLPLRDARGLVFALFEQENKSASEIDFPELTFTAVYQTQLTMTKKVGNLVTGQKKSVSFERTKKVLVLTERING